MNILLTGATGFVGSHLLKALLKSGHSVTILKRSFSDCARIKDVLDRCTSFDLDAASWGEVFSSRPFDMVVHCATNYGGKGTLLPEVMRANLLFPTELLDKAVASGCLYFINTDTCLTKQLPGRCIESKPLYRPDYTLTKYQFREWGKLCAIEKKASFVNMQMEHIYGPNDGKEKFIPYIIREMTNNASMLALTDGTQVRDFIHVDDVVRAYLVVLDNLNQLSGYQNFEVGTGRACTLRQFVEKIHHTLNSETYLHFGAVTKSDTEIAYSVADTASLQNLGWSTVFSEDFSWVLSE